MAMKLFPFHNQLVAHFLAHNKHDNFVFLNIIQGTQVSCPKFELGERIGSQPFDRFGGRRGLVLKTGQDSRFQDPLVTYRQRPELPVSLLRDGDLERHSTASAQYAAFQPRLPPPSTTLPPAASQSARSAGDNRMPATVCSYDRSLIARPQHCGTGGAPAM
jgi:hypothetical protein